MNKKLIAAAVSAVVIAPVAQAEMEVYGRINNAIDLNDLAADGESTTDISGVASRFGLRGHADLGNGLTAHGRYEFATHTDRESNKGGAIADTNGKESTTGVDDVRIATVGLSGAFGRVDIGNQWSAYFNTFGTLVSPTYTLGYYLYSSIGGGAYRASNTIKYSNSFGPVNLQLDLRLNGSDETADVAEKINGDGFGIGLSFAITDNITLAGSYDTESGADRGAREYQAYQASEGRAAVAAVAAVDGRVATADDVRDRVDEVPAYNVVDARGNLLRKVDLVPAVPQIEINGDIPAVDEVAARAASPDYMAATPAVSYQAADETPRHRPLWTCAEGYFRQFPCDSRFPKPQRG